MEPTLPPPPRVRLLGTGTAFNTDGRGSQALYVEAAGGDAFAVDLGPTALAAMERWSAPPDRLERVFFTHLHGDHIAGWPFLLLHLGFAHRRTRPLEVWGPAGVERTLAELSRLCFGDLVEPPRRAFELRFHELPPGEALEVAGGGLSFEALPMEHEVGSVGYRFDVGARTLAVTGDTRWCANLVPLARGADLLICECTELRPTGTAHLSLEELRSRVDELGARRMVLVHLTDEVATALAEDPLPRVVAGCDGMTLGIGDPAER